MLTLHHTCLTGLFYLLRFPSQKFICEWNYRCFVMMASVISHHMWNDLISKPADRIVWGNLCLVPVGWLYFISSCMGKIFSIIHLQHHCWIILLSSFLVSFVTFDLFSFNKTMRQKLLDSNICVLIKIPDCPF